MKTGTSKALATAALSAVMSALAAGTAGAVSLATLDTAPPRPEVSVPAYAFSDDSSPGSTALVPLVATDVQAQPIAALDVVAKSGGAPAVKPLDDIQFVARATESSREEVAAAQQAIPQLSEPRLKEVAEALVADHTNANEKLSSLAATKGWPVPGPEASTTPPAGSSSADFDSKWLADMIGGHERAAALYRAQAQAGEDKELRKYARDTLPTIERHLAELRSLQK